MNIRHDIDSCDQDDEDQDDAWLDGPVVKVKGKSRLRSHMMVKLEQDLAPTDRCNDEEQVKSRSMDRDGHAMI
jgi:hypothetical protein